MGETLVHVGLLVLAPPLVLGVITKTKAWFAGRKGPPVLQPYRDVWKLLHKGAVYSRTTTWVFRAGPIVALATALLAGLLVPLHAGTSPLGFSGDVLLFAYLLGLGRFFTMAAGMDTGSSFEGMGASREAAFSALAEPALLLGLGIVFVPVGSASFGEVWGALREHTWLAARPAPLVGAVVLLAVLLAENSRIPVDDPNTHLELTMVHEVMVLDHGGPDFAFVLYGSAVKLFVMGSLVLHIVLPIPPDGGWGGAALFLAGQLGLGVAIGIVESIMARLRLSQVPQFLIGATVLGAAGVVVAMAGAAR